MKSFSSLAFLLACIFVAVLLPLQASAQADNFFSVDQEISSGLEFYQNLANGKVPGFKVSTDTVMLKRINEIGARLSKVSMKRKGINYKFVLIESTNKKPLINAFSYLGGYICISKDLVNLFNAPGEIEFAIAHEMVHSDNADTLQRVNIITAINEQSKIMVEKKLAKNTIDAEALLKSYSRKNEYAADAYGALYLYRAGYNPEGAISAMGKLRDQSGEYPKGTEEWSEHPSYEGRIRNLKGYINRFQYIETLFSRGVTKLKDDQLDEAIECFNKFLSIFHGSPQAYNDLGYAYFLKAMKGGDTQGWYWSEGIDASYDRQFLANRGVEDEKALDVVSFNNAISAFRQSVEYDPEYAVARNNLIISYWMTGDNKKSQNELNIFLKTSPNNPSAYNTLGIIWAYKDKKKAENYFLKSMKMGKGYAPASFNLGLFYWKNKDTAKAKTCFAEFLKTNSDATSKWANAARDYIK